MKTNKILIRQDGAVCNLFIDGVQVHGVRYLNYDAEYGNYPILNLELFTKEVDIEYLYTENEIGEEDENDY
jgi:hypothetical protein